MTSLATRVLLIALCGIPEASGQYFIGYDKETRMQCQDNEAISTVRAVLYSAYFKDRLWSIGCKPSGQNTNCFWTGPENNWDQPLTYSCPGNYFMNGLSSFHDNFYEDRRFSIRCCVVPGRETRDCYFTDYLNNWHHDIKFNVDTGYVFKGLHSYHENAYEDRRWQFNVCRF